jgi:hypothetical protein
MTDEENYKYELYSIFELQNIWVFEKCQVLLEYNYKFELNSILEC